MQGISSMCVNISGSHDEIINMYKTEMETSNKNLVAECMLNKVRVRTEFSASFSLSFP